MKGNAPSYYPVFLNLGGKKCVVVGGGQVALRKVKSLLGAGAEVKVVSPVLCAQLTELAETGEIGIAERPFQPGDLEARRWPWRPPTRTAPIWRSPGKPGQNASRSMW